MHIVTTCEKKIKDKDKEKLRQEKRLVTIPWAIGRGSIGDDYVRDMDHHQQLLLVFVSEDDLSMIDFERFFKKNSYNAIPLQSEPGNCLF